MASYDDVRTAVLETGNDSRVEVNQRALIDKVRTKRCPSVSNPTDVPNGQHLPNNPPEILVVIKILARYASHGAVYRELLQNSNDAEAKTAEIRFSTTASSSGQSVVSQVVYRNDGKPFREADWSRLRNIAEGNPDVSKVGAFGVGAYTMFSICEEPLVISADVALAFSWRGDALWARSGPAPKPHSEWTTFVLSSRDPYIFPDLVQFGQFLTASLTFTTCLRTIRLYVNDSLRMTIDKSFLEEPTVITPPRASYFWSNDGTVTTSPHSIFSLSRGDAAITQSVVNMSATINDETHSVQARFVSAVVDIRVNSDMQRRIERVTKKLPPKHTTIHVFIDAFAKRSRATSQAAAITSAFSPTVGSGRIFIGFRTSQTTGLAAHLAAPLIPTVEREAVDLQDPTLRVYNSDLLFTAGVLMRLTLEHTMGLIAMRWEQTKQQREAEEKRLLSEPSSQRKPDAQRQQQRQPQEPKKEEKGSDGFFGFVRFMTSSVKKITEVVTNIDLGQSRDEDLFNPPDPLPLSMEEQDAVMLMSAFSPQQSTPDSSVGAFIARGFEMCMPKLSPPVLTKGGVYRSSECRLPHMGMEAFVFERVVRKVMLDNAETFLRHVAGCVPISLEDLAREIVKKPLSEKDFIRFLRWFVKYSHSTPVAVKHRDQLRNGVHYISDEAKACAKPGEQVRTIALRNLRFYREDSLSSPTLPMPPSLLPDVIQEQLTWQVYRDSSLFGWFEKLPFGVWAKYIFMHSSITDGRQEDSDIREEILVTLSKEHARRTGNDRIRFEKRLAEGLSNKKCVPFEALPPSPTVTEFPTDLYLPDAEIGIFQGLASFKKVSVALQRAGVSDIFLVAIGVRRSIAIDFLFTQLGNLKWNDNPTSLVKYLRTAALSDADFQKLQNSQYLPEVRDKSRTYAPSELYLPNSEIDIFSFVKVLQWPTTELLTEDSPDGVFLKSLGCKVNPPLSRVIDYIQFEIKEGARLMDGLLFLAKRLQPGGPYEAEYQKFMDRAFLPTESLDPIPPCESRARRECPNLTFTELDSKCMGFSVISPSIESGNRRLFASRFRCPESPSAEDLLNQLLFITTRAQKSLNLTQKSSNSRAQQLDGIVSSFLTIFKYLGTKVNVFSSADKEKLGKSAFIPVIVQQTIDWHSPSSVYFKGSGNEDSVTLFKVVEFDAFLAAVGVRSEPSPADLFKLLISSPAAVLEKVGEEEYRSILRRIAIAKPFTTVSADIRNSKFLLAYRLDENDELRNNDSMVASSARFTLAKAEDVCIVDNTFFTRMFKVLTAPQESDLERFYETLGSPYISKCVKRANIVSGNRLKNTQLASDFGKRLLERGPLLVARNISSRPLLPNASVLLTAGHFEVFEVPQVTATYALGKVSRTQDVSCAAERTGKAKCEIFITNRLDWFEAGDAIGALILKRCQLEDSFLLASILEAPIAQLRARGFPVDRILRVSRPLSTASGTPDARRASQNLPPEILESSAPAGKSSSTASKPNADAEPLNGYAAILQQMFPRESLGKIQDALGRNPDLEAMREAANVLAENSIKSADSSVGTPGSQAVEQSPTNPQGKSGKEKSKEFSNSFGFFSKALRSLKTGTGAQEASPHVESSGSGKRFRFNSTDDNQRVHSPQEDAADLQGVESVLNNAVMQTRKVSPHGVQVAEQALVQVPETVNQDGMACEVIPAADLKPFHGPSKTGKTSTGLRVFASRRSSDAEAFLLDHWGEVEMFAGVLRRLSDVYSVRYSNVAVYYEPIGRTCAFNQGGAIHFNVRFFIALLSMSGSGTVDASCYAYWYTVFAHELAHNIIKPHNQQHGFFTESFVHQFLPKFVAAVSSLPQQT